MPTTLNLYDNFRLKQSGVDEGSNADLWEIYLTSLGYEGSLEDKIKNFWLNY